MFVRCPIDGNFRASGEPATVAAAKKLQHIHDFFFIIFFVATDQSLVLLKKGQIFMAAYAISVCAHITSNRPIVLLAS